MQHFIEKVTITGADDSVKVSDLINLSKEFPFVEWGLLLSEDNDRSRYPSNKWLYELYYQWDHLFNSSTPSINRALLVNDPLCLSGHICGALMREICQGKWNVFKDCADLTDMFSRFQINLKSELNNLDINLLLNSFDRSDLWFRQFIFQVPDLNHNLIQKAIETDVDAVALYDLSGGTGTLPASWPTCRNYCGLAGGLTPINLEEQLEKMGSSIAKDQLIWIDVESGVRTWGYFDLDKVAKFLEIASHWVVEDLKRDPVTV